MILTASLFLTLAFITVASKDCINYIEHAEYHIMQVNGKINSFTGNRDHSNKK